MPIVPLGAAYGGPGLPDQPTSGKGKDGITQNPKTGSERNFGPNRRSLQHARYEEKFGLEDVVELLFPHLIGEAVIDGEPFDCPLAMHLDGDTLKMRLVSGKKRPKPYWKCEAGCCSDKGKGKHNDTLDFIRSALGIDYRKAITLWAKLAKAQPGERRAIVKSSYPKFYAEGLAE